MNGVVSYQETSGSLYNNSIHLLLNPKITYTESQILNGSYNNNTGL